MLGKFVTELSTLPERLRMTSAPGQSAAAIQLLHTARGLAATLGADALAHEAGLAEQLLIDGPAPGEADASMARTCAAIDAARPPLALLVEALSAAVQVASPVGRGAASEADRRELRAGLATLAVQLEAGDMAATETVPLLLARYAAVDATRLQALAASVSALDFGHALRQCRAFIDALAMDAAACDR